MTHVLLKAFAKGHMSQFCVFTCKDPTFIIEFARTEVGLDPIWDWVLAQ